MWNIMGKRRSPFNWPDPCSQKQVDEYYAILSGEAFGQDQIPTREFLRAVPNINPNGLIIIADSLNKVLGGIELYGLNIDVMNEYIAGKISDPDFKEKDLLKVRDIISDRRLYCAITIRQFKTASGDLDITRIREIRDHLIDATVRVIKESYFGSFGREPISIYAIAAADKGRALLKEIGFEEISDGRERKDKTPLYLLTSSENDLNEILARLLNPPGRPWKRSIRKPGDLTRTRTASGRG